MTLRMAERVVVITGASGGIGATLARVLAARGEQVVLAARRRPELEAVAAACGPGALAVVTDATRRAEVERLRDAALARHGHVDVWVNNAGQGIGRHVLDLSDDDLDAMMAVNVKSALYGMQAIVPHFRERERGHLVNVSSFLGRVPLVTFRSAYSAAKAALNSLTADLRVDLAAAHPGISVSLVLPGVVTTEFSQRVKGTVRPPMAGAAGAQSPEEVATAIADLLDHPVAELYTNPALAEAALSYYRDVAAFEAEARRRGR